MPRQPDPKTIRAMLDEVEAVTKARFYEDPEPVASPVEMFRIPEGKEGGEPFSALSTREKAQVLGDYTDWQEYQKHGVGHEQIDQVFWSVIQGEPRERWLDGTGLGEPSVGPQKPTLKEAQKNALSELLREIDGDAKLARSDEVVQERHRQRMEQGPPEVPARQTTLAEMREQAAKQPKPKGKARDIDMER